jgi:predicted nuclease of predicted toxin-antitoxin system
MRILLDECVDERLRHLFSRARLSNSPSPGFAGLKNGDLLLAAERAASDVIVTVDQNIPDQQTLANRPISLLILCGRTNRLSDLKPLVPAALVALASITRGQVATVRA